MKITNNNIDKKLETRSDGKAAKELLQLAKQEADPMEHIDLELMNALERAFNQAKDSGFTGSFNDWLYSTPIEDLKEIGKFKDGGLVDFSKLNPSHMKAIFISENGYEPKSLKELHRGVKMYLKGLDIEGVPFGVFGNK